MASRFRLRNRFGGVASTGGGGGGFSPEAEALFARFTTPATDPRKVLINNLIVGLVGAGLWSKYDALYVCAAETQQAAQRNWVADAFNLTEVAAPAWVADQGYTPNGTSSYCDTGFNPTTAPSPKYVQDSAYMAAWHRTDLANAGASSSDVGNATSRIFNLSTLQTAVQPNRSASSTIGVEAYDRDKAWSRTASGAWRYYNSGVIVGADPRNETSTALTSFNFGIGRVSAAAFGVNQCSVFRFGSSFTTAEQLTDHNLFQTYMTAIGAG